MFTILLYHFFGCDLSSESEAFKAKGPGTSLALRRLRLRLPVLGEQVQSLVGDLRTHMLPGPKSKTSRSNIVTNSVRTLKLVHIKTIFKK